MNIAINGFGRIGRAAFKILLERKEKGEDIAIVAINDLGDSENLAYLLKYDSVYRNFGKSVSHTPESLVVDGVSYKHLSIREPALLPWKDLSVDVVLECTGVFTKSEDLQKHLTAGARRVLLSAPAKDDGVQTVVLGGESCEITNRLVSNASCTTNSLAVVMHILDDAIGVEKALLTTVHAYTATQMLVDGPAPKDLRRGRAAAINIIPSSTGAAKAVGKVLPQFATTFDGVSLRVPVATGSISDITAVMKKDTSVEEINTLFKQSALKDEYKDILEYCEEEIVSSDIIQNPHSAIFDATMTRVVGGNLVKVMAWYDNEWGYANRLVDMALAVARA